MKKNNFKNSIYLVLILISGFIFSSCSDDEEDKDNDSQSIELAINNNSVNVFSDLSTITYRVPNLTGTKSLTATIFIDEDNSTFLSIQLLNLDLDNIKVGDDLANHKSYEVTLYYKKEMYLLNNSFVSNKDKFNEYKGQVVVTEYDKSKQNIKLEFKNITLPLNKNMYPDYNYLMKVKGYIKCNIETE
ncbi:hypothetical protein M2451_004111 [Dysgonomonas sp. PFB1-18]|uniref:hypothetical protein n=1 Tax=unclassified Dysgonomonas TaxID=2630389 RepID=UPI002474BD0E|nr:MULTISPECIES: hypothetical protein [unclassified Dysgonomonas]MDH6311180.1 hypothetical protein [Dysgonomonas sp. PF1-14]MDH6341064.1 hypothetical protein [Dysgonomonas sp. PF1-16]MDH6382761.1 hypothetical protein [Dysgonomonas sp. PFB1-18]MDH6400052.1 hypothetical protein [Dysgonomonas sp. PF1-23]